MALKTKNQSINQLNRSGLWQLNLRSVRGVQHNVIKFVSDLRQVGDVLDNSGLNNIWLSQGNFISKWLNEILKRINGRDR